MANTFPSPNLVSEIPAGLEPGTVIGGKYRIDGVLGVGGMGVVLRATHLLLRAPVAIKVVRGELAEHEAIVSRLIFEAQAAASLRSAHIVRVLDVARLPSGAPYIVMESLQGSDLAVALEERGTLPTREAVGYVLQACEGLAEAHAAGLIHRDLKPANLFLASTPEGVVLKILDFGISKDTGPRRDHSHPTLSREGTGVGSPFYMSPEQLRASPSIDARADIWSLGAILFELITGHCPFEADTVASLAVQVMRADAPLLCERMTGAPARLDAIIQRCLEKDPAARFASVTELAARLRAFLVADIQASSINIEIDVEPPVFPRGRHGGLALFASAALLIGGGIAFWQWQILGHAPAFLASDYSTPAAPRAASRVAATAATVASPGLPAEAPPPVVVPAAERLPPPTLPAASSKPSRSLPQTTWKPAAVSGEQTAPKNTAARYGL